MQALSYHLDRVWTRLPYIVRLAINTVLLPVALFYVLPKTLWRLYRANRHAPRGALPEVTPSDGQFFLEVASEDEVSRFAAAEAEALQILETGDWAAFLARMGAWDRARARGDGHPLTYAGSRAARAEQIAFLEDFPDCSQVPAERLNWTTVERLEMAFAHHHRDPVLAAILARTHLELGWARRGGGDAHTVPDAVWEGFHMHVARAQEILDDFDIAESGSAFLAAIAHMVALDGETQGRARDAAFATCLDLDPMCWDVMQAHAFHLLPRWGGDYEMLDIIARETMAKTPQHGAAAYAAFYLGVLERDVGALFACEPELFGEGLNDMARAEGSDPVLVNRLIQFCFDLIGPQVTPFGAHDAEINERRAAFETAADKLFFNHFTCHVPEVWTLPPDQVQQIAVGLYAPLLTAGGTVRLTRDSGIERSDQSEET